MRESISPIELQATGPSAEENGDYLVIRNRIVNTVLFTMAAGIVPALILSLLRTAEFGPRYLAWLHPAISIIVVVTVCLHRRLSYRVRISVLLGVSYVLAVGGLIPYGLAGWAFIWLLFLITLACVCLGLQAGIIALALSVGTLVLVIAGVMSRVIHYDFNITAYFTSPYVWILYLFVFVLMAAALLASLGQLHGALFDSIIRLQRQNAEIQKANVRLQEEMDARASVNEALRKEESRYLTLFEAAQDAIFILQEGYFVDFNPGTLKIFGCTREQILGKSPVDFSPPIQPDGIASQEKAKEKIERALEGHPQIFEWEHRRASGELFSAEVSLNRLQIGSQLCLQAIVRDITDRKKVEEALRLSEGKYRSIFENAFEGIFQSTPQGKFLSINSAGARIFGYESAQEMIGSVTNIGEQLFAHPEDRVKMLELLAKNGYLENYEFEYRRKDGQVLWLSLNIHVVRDANGAIQYLQGTALDITERKQAEKEKEQLQAHLMQTQKMQAIATLASGIAHDFNNILGAIIGYTEMALMDPSLDRKLQGNLEKVLQASTRATSLVHQILTFSRETRKERNPLAMKPIIKETLGFLRATLPSTIQIRQQLAKEGTILGDPTEIHEILMNLCTNAGLAMRESGGTLTVELNESELDLASAARYPDLKPGNYVHLFVKDTGSGIPPEIAQRIFEPFFTTRAEGQGTGLGLAVVRGIVLDCGGAISFSSEVGKGTTFEVLLPACQTQASTGPDQRPALFPGKERLLFVDDESMLVDLTCLGLSELGYRVSGFTNSLEALEAFQAHPEDFDLVISDMTMPGLTGDALARAVRKIRPDMPFILATGYSENMSAERAAALGLNALVAKPYLISGMTRIIREIMDQRCA